MYWVPSRQQYACPPYMLGKALQEQKYNRFDKWPATYVLMMDPEINLSILN
jgi:hypothetical protein